MRRALSISCMCLGLGWAFPAAAGDGPPVQRPRSRPAEVAPVEPEVAPVELDLFADEPAIMGPPAPPGGQLPTYHKPIAADALPEPERPRDRRSDNMILSGGVLFSAGVIVTMVGGVRWYENTTYYYFPGDEPEFDPKPAIISGIGVATLVTGATLLGVGIARHKRWKKGALETARLRLQPVVGIGQLGVVGRF